MICTLWITGLLHLVAVASASRCVFPTKWRGTWYQSRLGEIEIMSHSISQKGHCAINEGNKYLLLDRTRMCFRCLAFTPQHDNLLQFKESYCVQEDKLDRVCGMITGDFILLTIVKVPSIPIPCPFQGRYIFSYTNESADECTEPMSEIHACADKSRFVFHYKHCRGIPHTHNVRLSFQCLARWFNGEEYLYGKFTGPSMIDKEQMYRCFMYSLWGRGGEMAMSADATCQGLQSPAVGTNTVTLRQDVDNWPLPRCDFPVFFASTRQWRDIGGTYRVEISADNKEFSILDIADPQFLRYGEERSETRLRVKCIDVVNEGSAVKQEIDILTHTTNDSCVSAYQCMRLRSRAPPVLELYLGRPTDDQFTACDEINFALAIKHVVIPKTLQAIPCPFPGTYSYVEKMSDCGGKIKVGCDDETQMIVDASCPTGHRSAEILQCLFNWTELETQTMYIIASKPGDLRHTADCLAYRTSVDGFVIQGDNDCGGGRLRVMDKTINFIVHSKPEKCEVKQTLPIPVVKQEEEILEDTTPTLINSGRSRTCTNMVLFACVLVTSLFRQR